MSEQLHPSAERVLEAVARYWREHGNAPSVRDVQQAAGFRSSQTAAYWLAELREAGLVEWRERTARSLRLTPRGLEHLQARAGR